MTLELPRAVPNVERAATSPAGPAEYSAVSESFNDDAERPARRSWRSLFGPPNRRPTDSPPASSKLTEKRAEPDAPGALVVSDAESRTVGRPSESKKNRRVMKALPWGRDFAASIIHREDSLTAIFGKIDAADSPRVALVVPRGNRELSKALGMRRLRRHVDLTGKDVMLVTRSGSLKGRAREVGLAAVGSVRAVDFERYGRGGVRVGGVTVPLPGLGLFLRLTAFAVAIAALASVILLYLPQATVQVFPLIQSNTATSDITLSSDATVVNAASGEVPAHRRSLTITRSIPFPVTGQATVKGPDGADQTVAAATDDDIKRATAFAQQVLTDEGQRALQSKYKTETLFQRSATVSSFDTRTNVKAGEAAPLLSVDATGQVTMLSADNDSLQAVLKQALQGKVDARQMFVPETFTATTISTGNFDKNNNRLQVRVKLSEGTTRSFSVKKLREAVAGKGQREAQQAVIERVDQVQPATIKLEPGWAPWLPRFTSRIKIELHQPGDTSTVSGKPGASPTPGTSPTPKPQP